MTNNNLHTFAVLAYKNSPYLEECILSLKNQTVRSEIYIATSTPSGSLEQISEKYKIRLLVNKISNGIADDWSYAYDQCETEYLTLAHQDDIYLSRYTESCLSAAKRNPVDRSLIIFTGYKELVGTKVRNFAPHLFIKNVLLFPFLFKQNISSVLLKRSILSFGNSIPCPTVMYHKSELGSFEFLKDFRCNMDWDAWLRLSLIKGSFVYVKDKLLLHRINEDSQTSRQIKKNVRRKEDRLIFERLWPRPMGFFLASIYSLATKFNETQ